MPIFNDSGEPFWSNQDTAYYCNEYYINIGSKMASKITEFASLKNKYPYVTNSMFLKPIHRNEIISHITTLKNNSSPGFDGISTTLKNFVINSVPHFQCNISL